MAKKPTSKKLVELATVYAGCINDIAAACDVSRQTVNNWKNKDEKFREALKNGNDVLVDLALSGLKHLLEQKSERTIHYTLDRLARDKGFGQLVQIKDKSKFDDQFEEMTNDELEAHLLEVTRKIKNG